jgi:hypothetical protein
MNELPPLQTSLARSILVKFLADCSLFDSHYLHGKESVVVLPYPERER